MLERTGQPLPEPTLLRGTARPAAMLVHEGIAQGIITPQTHPMLFGLAATPGSLGQYLEKKLLDLVFGGTAFTAPATIYLALLSDTNTDAQRAAGTYTELANANAYARTAITNNTTNWPNSTAGSPASKANGATITPPTPTGGLWVQINGFLLTDSATINAGNILATGSFAVPVAAGATSVQVPVGGLVITLL